MLETNKLLLTIRIPGSIEQHKNLVTELFRNLFDSGEDQRLLGLGLRPQVKKQLVPDGICWKIRLGLDPHYPELHFTVFDHVQPNQVAAIQFVSDDDAYSLVKFIDAFTLDDQDPKDNLPKFPTLAKWFAYYLSAKKGGKIVSASKEQELSREENLKGSIPGKNLVNLRGGRPRNPDDQWAYQQVRDLGRAPADVFPEWQRRIKKSGRQLVDPLDSFKKAIKPRKGKK